ncbi:MAG: hypothetical protein R3240_06530 [Gammaproteobacteria bacterium]|nr:hypothetical protein [Gammaproteobacteria bacterium]
MQKNILLLFCALLILLLQGCALMMGKPSHSLSIVTEPADASIIVKDEKGLEVFKGQSPVIINLEKSAGPYKGGKVYMVTLSKPGYKTKIVPLLPVVSGYYGFGNMMTDGIGYFIDPYYGNMYDLSPPVINTKLQKEN